MPRKILFTAALLFSTALFGQDQSTNPTNPAPVNAPFGGPILVTPSASFPNPAPAAGISDAGRAGISIGSNSTAPVEAVAGTSGATSATAATAGGEANSALPTESTAPASDLIPSSSASSAPGTTAGGTASLAEISSRYKAEKGSRNARMLGNDDVEKMLANKSGVTMAKNMPPLGPGALEQGGQPQASGTQTPGAQTAGTQTSTTTSGSQSASAGQQGQTGATSQSATPSKSNPGQSASTDTSAENSTTPQVNQNQQSNDAQGSRRLPATGGFLPLLGLLGLVSGGIGFCFRKFRR